jgi:uncharacterized protein (UPF0147 family)
MNEQITEIIELLEELQGDSTVPRNVKNKLSDMQKELQNETGDLSLKVNKILSDVEEIANDINLPMFVRTQIWNLTSLLEGLNA